MKPRLGRTVYTLWKDSITRTEVAFLGEDSFLTEKWKEYSYGYHYDYKEYNILWFTSLSKAKKFVMECLDEDERKKVVWQQWDCGDYWELVYKEE